MNDFEAGLGQRVPLLISTLTQIIVSIILSFYFGWQLTLVVLSCFPLILIAGYIFSVATQTKN